MNVSYDEQGRLRLGHSGGFAMGAGTIVSMIPSEELGIVVLSNTSANGVAEGLAMDFTELALYGKKSQDWLAFFKKVFKDPAVLGEVVGFDYSKAPVTITPASPNGTYLGTYKNDFFGEMQVIERNGGLALELGPRKLVAMLKHYDRDTFTYETGGENAVGRSGVTFTIGPDGKSNKVLVEHLNEKGEGVFSRVVDKK
jgi:hypothetical protein